MTRSLLPALMLVIALSRPALAQEEITEPQPQLDTAPLVIVSDETRHGFTVEMADDPEEIRIGLMFRAELAEDAGMLFDLGAPRRAGFWMKNTILPLDMLFIDSDGEILAIARNTVPGSLRQVDPGVPVRAVLEVNAGTTAQLGIEAGDYVEHALFSTDDS